MSNLEMRQRVTFSLVLQVIMLNLRVVIITLLGLLLFIIPGVVYYTNRLLAYQVLVLEGLGVTESMSRSKELMNHEPWYSMQGALARLSGLSLFLLMGYLIVSIITTSLGAVLEAKTSSTLAPLLTLPYLAFGLISQIVPWFNQLVFAGLFCDLLVRHHGYDIAREIKNIDTETLHPGSMAIACNHNGLKQVVLTSTLSLLVFFASYAEAETTRAKTSPEAFSAREVTNIVHARENLQNLLELPEFQPRQTRTGLSLSRVLTLSWEEFLVWQEQLASRMLNTHPWFIKALEIFLWPLQFLGTGLKPLLLLLVGFLLYLLGRSALRLFLRPINLQEPPFGEQRLNEHGGVFEANKLDRGMPFSASILNTLLRLRRNKRTTIINDLCGFPGDTDRELLMRLAGSPVDPDFSQVAHLYEKFVYNDKRLTQEDQDLINGLSTNGLPSEKKSC